MRPQRTLWIVGTSVSIEHGGYVTQLQALAAERGWRLRNLSVGDQTSVMGCMRVLAHRSEFARGDVVVWEYSLLDHLLTQGIFPPNDVRSARRFAWNLLRELGVPVIALLTAPREELANQTPGERELCSDAATIGVPVIDIRALFVELGITDPHRHYRDDRHPLVDSPVVALEVARILDSADEGTVATASLEDPASAQPWQWIDAATLAQNGGLGLQTFANSLVSIQAVQLAIDDRAYLPATRRVVALGVVSTHASGGAWCGHPGCPPASTRLPADLPYSFLLRATGIACIRAHVDRIVSAPEWAYRNGHWHDYGQAECRESATVAVFGALIETSAHGLPEDRHRDQSLFARMERRIKRWIRA